MKNLYKVLPIFVVALALAAFSTTVVAQDPGQQPMVARGELLKVDTSNNTFTIRAENGQEMEFNYNSSTKVEGATTSIAGLSNETGNEVTVHYKEENGKMWAERIDVKKKSPGR